MRLVAYAKSGTQRLGVLHGTNIFDLSAAFRMFSETDSSIGNYFIPDTIDQLLLAPDPVWEKIEWMYDWIHKNPTQFSHAHQSGDGIRLLPPVQHPSKIICIGLNYHDHCREQNVKVPSKPLLFAKFPSAIIGNNDLVSWPAELSSQVDFEAELAVVIRKKAKNVKAKDYLDYVAGYTILNDISARDVQFADEQWVRGKSFDTFSPLGPMLVTPREIGDPHNLSIRCLLNKEVMQDSNTYEMIFKIPFLIEYVTQFCTLLPGDILSTGTPNGVGVFRTPQRFLQKGDVVEVEIEEIGCLRNTIR